VVTPQARKEAARHLKEIYRLSTRRACRLVSLKRSVFNYCAQPDKNAMIRERMLMLAKLKPRYGYKRLHLLLKREGFAINRKRVERLYRVENLSLRKKRAKKRRSGLRTLMPILTTRNEAWSMDFVSDALDNGRRFRSLTIIDNYTKESPWIEVGF
jgi:putative transposase